MSSTKHHMSRRSLLQKSAAAGAVFWAVPVIESVTSRAAAGSMPCSGTPGPLGISGAGVIFQINGTGTVYWTAFASNSNVCETSPTLPNDSDFASAVSVCGGTVLISGGSVQWNGATPTPIPVAWATPNCYFTATSNGIAVTSAGVAAGVTVLVWLLHNGNVSPCTPYGSKGHWALGCGGSQPGCAGLTASGCIT